MGQACAGSQMTSTYEPDGPEAKQIASVIPYYPFKGIDKFYDMGGLCANPKEFELAVDIFVQRYKEIKIDSIGMLDARGFLMGPPIAMKLGIPCFMLRKKGKMPNTVAGDAYTKEYAGSDILTIQKHAVKPGDRVLLVDDLIATGGTMGAAVDLVRKFGGEVVDCACLVELSFLKGRDKTGTPPAPVWSLISESILTVQGELPEGYEDDGAPH